jgi:hypothetical protein
MKAILILAIFAIACIIVWIALRPRLGPIILCIDKSGSMYGFYRPNGEESGAEWSQRFALAMQNTARRQRRDLHLIYFNHQAEKPVLLKRGRGKIPQPGPLGGTEFSQPLNLALELVKDDEQATTIVMLTDGLAYTPDGWVESFQDRCRDLGVKVHLAYLSSQAHPYQDPTLAYPFADYIHAVNMDDLTTPDPYALIKEMRLR